MNIRTILKQAEVFLGKNSPTILASVGVVGVVGTAVLASRASIQAYKVVDSYEGEARVLTGDKSYKVNSKTALKLCWKLYIPTVIAGGLTVASIVCSNRVADRRIAAAVGAYALSERRFGEYRDKIVEKLGEKKEQEARAEVSQESIDKRPMEPGTLIVTGTDDVRCYEAFTGRYFTSSMETLKKAQNDVNYEIINGSYASLGTFYDKIGLPATSNSEDFGWTTDTPLELVFTTALDHDQKPVIHIEYDKLPHRSYWKL